MLTCRRTCQVWSHHQNSREAGMSKDISGDEGLNSEGTKIIQIFIKAEYMNDNFNLRYAYKDEQQSFICCQMRYLLHSSVVLVLQTSLGETKVVYLGTYLIDMLLALTLLTNTE
ncbi:hypothetical protein Tco_1415266 [Tanacetum coccineum]